MNDYPRARCVAGFNRTLQPDSLVVPSSVRPARAFATLDVAVLSWPGHGAPMTAGFQYNEKEWMLADEYDLLIDDRRTTCCMCGCPARRRAEWPRRS